MIHWISPQPLNPLPALRGEGDAPARGCCGVERGVMLSVSKRLGAWFLGVLLVAALLTLVSLSVPARAQQGPLFPEPFVVEHHLVQSTPDGDRFATQPVTDYYGGSWIVSVRPDGTRVVVDLARREITGIQPDQGTYWTVTFDRLGDLADRLVRAQSRREAPAADSGTATASRASATTASKETPATAESELVVEDLGNGNGPAGGRSIAGKAGASGSAALFTRDGVRHLRVVERSRESQPDAGMELWLDPSVTLRPAAVEALAALGAVLGKPRGADAGANADAEETPVDRYLAAARAHTGGAMAVRTVRTVGSGPPSLRSQLEDVTTRLERIDDFPQDLVAVPEGLHRVPHPLEGVVRFLEDETRRDRAMAGAGGGQ